MMNVVQLLKKDHARALNEVTRLATAIKALTGGSMKGVNGPKRVLSVEARARIAAAQRARWAKTRRAAKNGTGKGAGKD